MKQTICPSCGGSLESVAIGWRCKKCKGFISLQNGKFFEYVEKPFMPPKTNADRIRAMPDEELYDLFREIYNAGCDDATAWQWGTQQNTFVWEEEWLKQPAEVNDG